MLLLLLLLIVVWVDVKRPENDHQEFCRMDVAIVCNDDVDDEKDNRVADEVVEEVVAVAAAVVDIYAEE